MDIIELSFDYPPIPSSYFQPRGAKTLSYDFYFAFFREQTVLGKNVVSNDIIFLCMNDGIFIFDWVCYIS